MNLSMTTVGHGTATRDELAALLRESRLQHVVDVRRFPGSRHNLAAARGHIEGLARELRLGYSWDERLGGRRALSRAQDAASPDTWWRVKAFRAYAAWTRSDGFRAGMSELISGLARQRTAVMCSESVWWRCHRRIIADVAVAKHGVSVAHLMHDGRLVAHELSGGARLNEQGDVVWDGAT